jgi:nucleoside-diphosphate-sugar epimerase
MTDNVLVLGANGRLGRCAARAFADAGWQVLAQACRPLADADPRLRAVALPATDTAALAQAAAGATVVVNAMNPLYTDWDRDALPLNAAAIAVARALDATLMFPGNVYNFGARMPARLAEDTPQRPTTRKGELRCAMEAAIRAEAPRSIVVRAGDFFGGPGTGSWFDQAIVKDLARGKIVYPGPRDRPHAWACLPDLAATFVRLAQVRAQLAAHETFHFPGHTATGEQLVQAIVAAARRAGLLAPGAQPRVAGMPWPLLRVAGLFNPMLRELARMSYLWFVPHELEGDKLVRAIGAVPVTPLDMALDRTLAELAGTLARAGRR